MRVGIFRWAWSPEDSSYGCCSINVQAEVKPAHDVTTTHAALQSKCCRKQKLITPGTSSVAENCAVISVKLQASAGKGAKNVLARCENRQAPRALPDRYITNMHQYLFQLNSRDTPQQRHLMLLNLVTGRHVCTSVRYSHSATIPTWIEAVSS